LTRHRIFHGRLSAYCKGPLGERAPEATLGRCSSQHCDNLISEHGRSCFAGLWVDRVDNNSTFGNHQNVIMGVNSFVEPIWEPELAHGLDVSHHEPSPLPNRETRRKQNDHTCRGASCLLTNLRLPQFGFGSRALLSVVFAFFVWSSLIGTALATNGDQPSLLAVHVEDDLAWKGSTLFVDHQLPPIAPLLMPPLHHDDDATRVSKRGVKTDPAASNSDFTIPEPFDTGLSNNFTSTCASFLVKLRADDSFRKCHPFSLLLQVCLLLLLPGEGPC
jgi:hypothetical protein